MIENMEVIYSSPSPPDVFLYGIDGEDGGVYSRPIPSKFLRHSKPTPKYHRRPFRSPFFLSTQSPTRRVCHLCLLCLPASSLVCFVRPKLSPVNPLVSEFIRSDSWRHLRRLRRPLRRSIDQTQLAFHLRSPPDTICQ